MCVVKGQGHVWPSNFKGQDYGHGQTHWSHLRPGVQSICCFTFRGNRTPSGWDIGNSIFDLENPRSRSWPRSNLMVGFEAFEFIRYVCLSFRGNRTVGGGVRTGTKTKSNPGIPGWLNDLVPKQATDHYVIQWWKLCISAWSIKSNFLCGPSWIWPGFVNFGKYFMPHGIIVLQLNSGFFLPDTFWNVKH